MKFHWTIAKITYRLGTSAFITEIADSRKFALALLVFYFVGYFNFAEVGVVLKLRNQLKTVDLITREIYQRLFGIFINMKLQKVYTCDMDPTAKTGLNGQLYQNTSWFGTKKTLWRLGQSVIRLNIHTPWTIPPHLWRLAENDEILLITIFVDGAETEFADNHAVFFGAGVQEAKIAAKSVLAEFLLI